MQVQECWTVLQIWLRNSKYGTSSNDDQHQAKIYNWRLSYCLVDYGGQSPARGRCSWIFSVTCPSAQSPDDGLVESPL